MDILNKFTVIFNTSFFIWVLNQSAEEFAIDIRISVISEYNLNPNWNCPGQNQIPGLGENILVYEEFWLCYYFSPINMVEKHVHGFRPSCGLIQKRSIRQGQTSQITHHGLVIQ